MQTIILAAGRGSRMEELTSNENKVMLKVPPQNYPILQHTIENVKTNGLKDFIIIVGYKKESIMQYFGDGSRFGVNIKYAQQSNIKGGTADALKAAHKYISSNKFLLIYGDVVPSPKTIQRMLITSQFSDGIAVREVNDPSRYGVVDYDTKTLKVRRILEKSLDPPTNVINAGIYVLSKKIFEFALETPMSERGEYELTTTINDYTVDDNTVVVVPIVSIRDIGTKKEYQALIQEKSETV